MEKQDIIKSITERTNGELYLGVVGAVRTGKSTFIKKVIENLVVVVEEPIIMPQHLPPYMYSKNEYQYKISVDDIADLGEELEKLEKATTQEEREKRLKRVEAISRGKEIMAEVK